MTEYVDYHELHQKRDWFNWYNLEANQQEKRLWELVYDLSDEYFLDFRFEEGTIVDIFTKAESSIDDGETWIEDRADVPEALEYFSELILKSYLYKVEPLSGDILGEVNHKEHSITIAPSVMSADDCKPHVLHEIIHIYEEVLDNLPKFYHDTLLLCLYNDLKNKITDLDDRIISHTHVLYGERITRVGGNHDILFFLKSLDLDIRCGYKLGTVCGYGRDEHGEATGERMERGKENGSL